MQALLYSMPLTPWQVSVDPRLCLKLLDTHRQVWLSLLWGHCSFLLGPSAHKVLCVLSNSLFPQSCVSSVIKSLWPSKSNSLWFSVPFPDLQVRKSVAGPRTFTTVWELWDNYSPVCGLYTQRLMVGLTHHTSQVCCSESPCPQCRPLLTRASAADTQTLKGRDPSFL